MNKQTLTAILSGVAGSIMTVMLLYTLTTLAAPTQAPPNGNPAFPLTGPQGSQGPTGLQGATGATGPAGTWAPNRCQTCIEVCDWNGSGPCSQTCATEGNGWSSRAPFYGDVDGNDTYRVYFDCW